MVKRILRPAESQARLGIKKTQYYEWRKSGKLKPPLQLGPASVGDLEFDIDALIDQLAAARDSKINQHKAALSSDRSPRAVTQHTKQHASKKQRALGAVGKL